jgi:hypothetical protein
MIGYYFYGRVGDKGFVEVNHFCSKKDAETVLSKMSQYVLCKNSDPENLPKKEFFFNFRGTKGRTGVFGRTTQSKGNQISGSRDNIFTHEYLFQDEDRMELLENGRKLLEVNPFCNNMTDIYKKVESSERKDVFDSSCVTIGRETYAYSFDESNQNVYGGTATGRTVEELLAYFDLTDQKLEEFLYTFFLPVNSKVYLMLPENTGLATEYARELMAGVLNILPRSLVETAGFVTYAVNVNPAERTVDHIPAEVRYVFAANTATNQEWFRKKERNKCVFCKEEESNVQIPQEMRGIVEAMKTYLLKGEKDNSLKWFWRALNQDLKTFQGQSVSEREIRALKCFYEEYYCTVNDLPSAMSEEELFQILQVLRAKPENWTEYLERDILNFLKAYIQKRGVEEAHYEELYQYYEQYEKLHKEIERFFCDRMTSLEQLEAYMQKLESCKPLKRAVAKELYQNEEYLEIAAEYEFGILEKDGVSKGADAEEWMDSLFRKLKELKESNEAFPSVPCVIEKTETCLRTHVFCGKNSLEKEEKLLETALSHMEQLMLPKEYIRMLILISEEYLRLNGEKIYEKYEDPEPLRTWPNRLVVKKSCMHELIRRLENKQQFARVENEFRSAIKNRDVGGIFEFLYRVSPDKIALLHTDERLEESIVRAILNKALSYHEVKGKQAEKEQNFDLLHREMLKKYPLYQDKILFNVMKAPLGGIAGMSSIFAICEKDWEFDMDELKDTMKDAVWDFFEQYDMSRKDKRAIRQESKFLRKIGISTSELLEH